MLNANQGAAPPLDGATLRIGIVQARFNAHITDALAAGCVQELRALGVADGDITHLTVPGALEIPVALDALAQRVLASQNRFAFDALIAIGCIIRGETYHFELVANESAAGITRVALESRHKCFARYECRELLRGSYSVPIANAILTVENEAQAKARISKGAEAARVAVEMVQLLAQQS